MPFLARHFLLNVDENWRIIPVVYGFALSAFGIDERIEDGTTKVSEFSASKAGEYGFHCSYVCAMGQVGVTGKLVVEY